MAGSGESTKQLALATIAFAVTFSAWGMLAPIAPDIQDELGLSNIETSVMISIPVVLGALLRIPLGLLTDRIGGRRVFAFMLVYSAGAALLVGFASSYAALLGAGFLLGAAGATFAVGVPFVAEWVEPKRQGFALGVYGIGNVGTAVAAFAVPAIRDSAGQEVAGLVIAAVIAVYALIWWGLARDLPGREPKRQPYGEVLRSGWDLYRLSLFYFVTFGGFVAMALFLPKLLTDWFDLSLTDAGLRAAGFTLLRHRRPPGRWAARRPDRRRAGARARLHRGRGRCDRSLLAGLGPVDGPGHDLLPDDGGLPRRSATARFSSRCRCSSRRRPGPRPGSSAPPAGSAASSRRCCSASSRTRPVSSCSASSSSSPSPGCARAWPSLRSTPGESPGSAGEG